LNSRVQNRLTLDEVKSFDDVLRLYFTREEAGMYNHQRLRDCKQPILKIKSTHIGQGAEAANDDEADGLDPQLCICLEARVKDIGWNKGSRSYQRYANCDYGRSQWLRWAQVPRQQLHSDLSCH
jgi:hypothetical protein